MQRRTPIKVGATAGLRLLPGGKADDILAAVKAHLAKDYPFQLEQVTIIDGELTEPACMWRLSFQWSSWMVQSRPLLVAADVITSCVSASGL